MKSLTERERDLADMKSILGFNINFNTLWDELDNQKEFKFDILGRLLKFEEQEKMRLPIPETLRKEYDEVDERKLKEFLVRQIKNLKEEGKNSVEICDILDLSEEELKDLSNYFVS